MNDNVDRWVGEWVSAIVEVNYNYMYICWIGSNAMHNIQHYYTNEGLEI